MRERGTVLRADVLTGVAGSSVSEGTLPDRSPVLRVAPMPADVNANGDIFGGWIMSQVDIAGGITASVRARGRVVTVAVNSFTFEERVLVGDLVSFFADVERVGTTVPAPR